MIKPWLKQEMIDEGITADATEIAMILSGLLKEKALDPVEIERFKNASIS